MPDKNKKLLIVEDDYEIAGNISEIFEDCGYSIYTAYDGAAGIRLARDVIPDLIICDIKMPLASGYQVKSILAENPATSGIPFVFLTAYANLASMRTAMDLGADDYIAKPVSVKDLYNIVHKRINHINDLKSKQAGYTRQGYSINDTIILKKNKERIISKVENISVIKSLGVYSQVVLASGKKSVLKRSLKKWIELLPSKGFIRVHRNFIINYNTIEKLESGKNGVYNITVKGYSEVIISSQRYSKKIRDMNRRVSN